MGAMLAQARVGFGDFDVLSPASKHQAGLEQKEFEEAQVRAGTVIATAMATATTNPNTQPTGGGRRQAARKDRPPDE